MSVCVCVHVFLLDVVLTIVCLCELRLLGSRHTFGLAMGPSKITGNPLLKGKRVISKTLKPHVSGSLSSWAAALSKPKAPNSAPPVITHSSSSQHHPVPAQIRDATIQHEGSDNKKIKMAGHAYTGVDPESSHRKADRPYQPEVHAYAKGSVDEALKETATEEQKAVALRELYDDMYSRGSEPQRAAAWNTWKRFHANWFHNDLFLPLTVVIINAVAATFKKGKYRSFGNYMTAAKHHHIEQGHDFNDPLKLAAARADRAVSRGQGPAQQAVAVELETVGKLKCQRDPLVVDGAVWPVAAFVVGCMFLLREIELAAMEFRDLTFDAVKKVVTVRLPVSKSDSKAKGCERMWGVHMH